LDLFEIITSYYTHSNHLFNLYYLSGHIIRTIAYVNYYFSGKNYLEAHQRRYRTKMFHQT